MASSWQTITLEEFAQHQKGFAFKSKDYIEEGVAVVRVSNLTANSIDTSDLKYVSEEVASDKSNFKLTHNDVIIATVGSWPKNPASVVGKVIKVPKNCDNFLLNQNAVRFRVKTEDTNDQLFLYYLLKSKTFSDYIISTAQGSANQASITLKDIYAFEFECPSPPERKEIAQILSAIDDKSNLNSQTNQTLEQMAQALFKSWFVDFDPVIDNALAAGNEIPEALQHKAQVRREVRAHSQETAQQLPASPETKSKPLPDGLPQEIRALFPSEFEQTGDLFVGIKGWVPKGWNIAELGSLVDFATGPAFKSKNFSDKGIKLSRGDNVKEGFFHWGSKTRYWPEITPELKKHKLQSGDILIGMDGSKVGKNWVRVTDKDLPCLLVQRVARLRSKGLIGSSYLSVLIGGDTFKQYVDTVKTGTSIPHISGGQIKQMKILSPDDNGSIFQKFENVLADNLQRLSNSLLEIETLIRLRDVLLPKLVSGEITINKEVA